MKSHLTVARSAFRARSQGARQAAVDFRRISETVAPRAQHLYPSDRPWFGNGEGVLADGPSRNQGPIMKSLLQALLKEPRTRNLPVDGVDFSIAHREILRSKPQTQLIFESFYRLALALEDKHCRADSGARWEVGSGAGFLGEFEPGIITSDIKPLPFLDYVCSADALPAEAASIRAIFAFNVFHHLPSPTAFFQELTRVLKPGGVAILMEPAHTPLARLVFPRLFASEGYEPEAPTWDGDTDAGPMSRANQAAAYIVFVRDRKLFETKFPELDIVDVKPHAHVAFLGSGGVNFRALIPSWAMKPVIEVERLLTPLDSVLGLQQAIVLRRR